MASDVSIINLEEKIQFEFVIPYFITCSCKTLVFTIYLDLQTKYIMRGKSPIFLDKFRGCIGLGVKSV